MADEQWLKANIVYGSAGMAAAGMVPPEDGPEKTGQTGSGCGPKEGESPG